MSVSSTPPPHRDAEAMIRAFILIALVVLAPIQVRAAERPTDEQVSQLLESRRVRSSAPPIRVQRMDLPGPWEGNDAGFYKYLSAGFIPGEDGSFVLYANGTVGGNFVAGGYGLNFVRQVGRDYYYTFQEGSGHVVPYLFKLTEELGQLRVRQFSGGSLGLEALGSWGFNVAPEPDGSLLLSFGGPDWFNRGVDRGTIIRSIGKLVESPTGVLQVYSSEGFLLAPLPTLSGRMGYETSFHRWIEEFRLAESHPELPTNANSATENAPSLYSYRGTDGKWMPLYGVAELNAMLRAEITTRAEAEEFLSAGLGTLSTRVLAGQNSATLTQHNDRAGIWRLQTSEKQLRLLPYEVDPRQKVEGERWSTEFNVLTGTGAIRRYRLAGRLQPFEIVSQTMENLEPDGTFRPFR